MKKGGGSESTIIVGPSKSVLVYALHSLEYVLGLARFRVFVPKLYYYYPPYKSNQDTGVLGTWNVRFTSNLILKMGY